VENLLRRQNEQRQLLVEIEEQLERLSAIEEFIQNSQEEWKNLRRTMLRIRAWNNSWC
jgi:hypothetical protein